MLSLILAAALAQVDGGVVDAGRPTTIYDKCPEVDYADGGHAPVAFPVLLTDRIVYPVTDGGTQTDWYLPYPRPQRTACKLTACEERNRELEKVVEEARQPVPPAWIVVTGVLVGVAAGVAGTLYFCSKVNVCK